MVSVVIPTYNRAGYLKEAVGSALAQTHKDTEVIVVDDSSTDGTGSVAASFGDSIRYILQDNRERGAARNSGIR
ncbi:MAG TPA: glycosyltransferase family A protein, partial [Candidatus Omnitrophota bacterium]|nr:glycosyltransferase family A protein [Candidatus Omnitrophota bacterium]